MPIQRFFDIASFNTNLINIDIPALLKQADSAKSDCKKAYKDKLLEQVEVDIVSGSLSVDGISYTRSEKTHFQGNAAVINLPIERRIYIDQLKGIDTLIIVDSGELLISGIPFTETQIAWTSGLEQFVISALAPHTSATVISLAA